MIAQGSNARVLIKKQSAFDTPASGAGATLVNVRPSQGLANTVATIESALLDRSGMRPRGSPGSRSSSAVYESEGRIGNTNVVFGGVLTHVVPAFDLDNTDLTSVAVTDTGTTLTFGADAIAAGLLAGMVLEFTGLSETGNNGVRVPILGWNSATVARIPAGIVIDMGADTAFNVHVYRTYYTPDPRVIEYFTVEQQYPDLATPNSLVGTDMKFNALNFGLQPNQPLTIGFGLAGRDLQPAASYPQFSAYTDETITGAGVLKMLDGGALYKNGVAMATITGLTMGLSANSTITPLLVSRIGLDVGLSSFAFAGQVSAVLTAFGELQDYYDETPIEFGAMFVQDQDPGGPFLFVYAGDCVYGGANAPIAEQDIIQTLPLYGGLDTRGVANGYARSTFVISTSE